jgi:chromosome segregation ATPase
MDVEKEKENTSIESQSLGDLTTSVSINYFINKNKLLKSQCSILNDENSKLKTEIFKLNLSLNSKNDEIIILGAKLERLEKINNDLNNKNKSFLDDIEKVQNELSLLVQDSQNKLNKISEMNNEKLNFEKLIINLKQEILEKENSISHFSQEVKDLNMYKTNLNNQILAAKNDLTNEKFLVTSLNNEINNLRSHLTNQENINNIEKNSLRLSISNLTDQILLIKEESITNEQRLNLKIHELSNENQSLKFQNENLELKISENTSNLELKDRKIEELSNIILELQRHIKKSESEIEMMREFVKDKEIEIKNLHSVKRRLDEYSKIENSIQRGEVISANDIYILRDEYKKVSSMFKITLKDLDTANKNNEDYRENLKDYEEVKKHHENLLNDYNKISNDYYLTINKLDELEKNNSELVRENEIMNEFANKISMQNKNLLLELKLGEIRSSHSHSYLQTNLSKQDYEEFLYKNINDLEAKFSELSKKLISITKDKEKLIEENENLSKNLTEKEVIINSLENNLRKIEEMNKKLKNEYDTLKYYSESHYTLFTLKFASRDENQEKVLLELNNKLDSYEAIIKSLEMEKEKIIKNYNIVESRNSNQANEILKLKNNLLEKEKDLNTIKSDLNKHKVTLSNNEALNTSLRNENESLKLKYEQIRSMSDSLFREKESLISDMKTSIELVNIQLAESQGDMKVHIEKLLKENENLKNMFNDVKNEFSLLGLGVVSSSDRNIHLVENLDLATLKRELNLIKEKFQTKDREYLRMKENKTELDIKLENVLTENWTLKNQLEFLENRLKYYQTISHNKPLTGTINISSINNIGISSEEKEENINEINNTQIQNQNIDTKLYEDYAKLLKQLENIKSENHILKQNILDLNTLNQSLVSNDISAPYKYLLNKIEELNNKNRQLESTNQSLIKEKEKIYEDFAFLNLKNESIMQTAKLKDDMIIELNEKISILQKDIEEGKRQLEVYSQSSLIIEEKENLIKKLVDEINTLNEKIILNDTVLKEKENTINQQLSNYSSMMESKNKEVGESKAKFFKMFYIAFKRAKAVIEVLNKLRETLEEKISSLVNNPIIQPQDFTYVNNKLKDYENTISQLQEKLNSNEENYNINLSNLTKELESYQEKEKTFVNEIKTFKNINQMEGSVDMKSHFVKMLKTLTSAMNIIKFKDSKLNILEKENKDLQVRVSNMQSMNVNVNVVDLTKSCEKCEIYLSEVNMLSKSNRELVLRINSEGKKNYF